MTLIKKSDVKNHLSGRSHNGIHLYKPEKQIDGVVDSAKPLEDLDSKTGLIENAPPQPTGSSVPKASSGKVESA